MDKNELNDWIEQRLAHLDANTCEPNTDRAFDRLKLRLRLSRPRPGDNSFDLLRVEALACPEVTKGSGINADSTRRALAPEIRHTVWLLGAAVAASVCLCLLAFPTSRDVVQRLFTRGSNSRLVYVGQVYADLKTMKDKQPEVDFTIEDIEGHNITLSALKGKVVLLNFWATWCGGCRTEIPWLVEFDRKYRDKGLVVIGISEDHIGSTDNAAWKSVEAYVKTAAINYPVAVDDGSVANSYSLLNMPATYLIDRDGKVSAASVGIIDKAECEAEILRLLGN